VTSDPRAFFAVDHGTATTSVALIGRVSGCWRLLASTAAPAAIPDEPLLRLLIERIRAADADLASVLGADEEAVGSWTRVACRSRATPALGVAAVSDRALATLKSVAERAGWRVVAGSAESMDPLEMTRVLLDPSLGTILVGAGEPPGADERSSLDELGALAAAVAARRPELTVVLAGAMAEQHARFRAEGEGEARNEIILAPAADAGDPAGAPLRTLIEGLRATDDDSRRAIARAAGSLSDVLDRRVEVVEIGMGASLRALATPMAGDAPGRVEEAVVAAAGIDAGDPDDDEVDRALSWSTVAIDRHRLRDRLSELRLTPWGEAHGDGALLRIAVARAALQRLAEATPEIGRQAAPDLLVAAGGMWAVAPGPAIALAVADIVRRPGASQLAFDHARLLGPLGTIADEAERRAILRDLAGDLLVPLGTVIMPQGMRAGRSAGRLVVHAAGGTTDLDLVPGGLELVDLPPGESAVAELDFRDTVRLGARGRHFAVPVSGGLAGLLVDLRDVPLRLPERPDRRRELLAAWQEALWTGGEG
jgi:hypothetical protein